jgi:hypothetical protein
MHLIYFDETKFSEADSNPYFLIGGILIEALEYQRWKIH